MKEHALGNHYTFRVPLQTLTGEPALGLTIQSWLSATKSGDPIDDDLSVTLDEGETDGAFRLYEKQLANTTSDAILEEYVGRTVFERAVGPGYDDYLPVKIVRARLRGT